MKSWRDLPQNLRTHSHSFFFSIWVSWHNSVNKLVINKSLTSGIFSQVYKVAIVKLLLKKFSLDRNDLKNFCHVSNLSFVSKIIEKVILSQLFSHLFTSQLFNPFRSTYRPRHSTETAVLKAMNDPNCTLLTMEVYLFLLWLTCQLPLIQQIIRFFSNVLNMSLACLILLSTGSVFASQTELWLNNCSSAPVPHQLWSLTGICPWMCSFCSVYHTFLRCYGQPLCPSPSFCWWHSVAEICPITTG